MSTTYWIIIAVVALLVIAALVLGFIGLSSLLSPRAIPTPTPGPSILSLSPAPTFSPTLTVSPTTTPTPTPSFTSSLPNTGIANSKTFFGQGFSLQYPSSWGLLTCINSPNFEFNPQDKTNQMGAICSFATQPITVLVSSNLNGCFGENVNLGTVSVIRGTSTATNLTTHQWCTLTQPVLKVSHRVSLLPVTASSQTDFSSDIEAVISTLRFTNQ